MKPEKPITRKEMYLDVATGGSTELPSPVTREEKYLAKIAGESVDVPTPVTRYEMLLAAVAGESYTLTPVTRLEIYLAKAAGQDVEIPQPVTREEMYWFDYCGGTPTPPEREYTGAVPVTFIADGTPLLDYLISGNTTQSGTPTPQNPVMPEGCGDLETTGERTGQYKIPISSANTTTPVYLGEVKTTRRVKKYEFTGNEEWFKGNYAPSGGYQFFTPKPSDIANNPDWLMTHFKKGSGLNGSAFASYLSLYPEASLLPENATANDFKEWVAAQYAAGTPVTVWYVLANEETGVVNEPLMKIGDYADTLSMEQAGVSVPTVAGSNTLDVLTEVKPSEVYIKYKGEPVPQLSMLSSHNADEPEEAPEEAPEELSEEEAEEETSEETESITPETAEE